jgi:hypothetical protein
LFDWTSTGSPSHKFNPNLTVYMNKSIIKLLF